MNVVKYANKKEKYSKIFQDVLKNANDLIYLIQEYDI